MTVRWIISALLCLSLGGWSGFADMGDTNAFGTLGHVATKYTATCATSDSNADGYTFSDIATGASGGDAGLVVVGVISEDGATVFGVDGVTIDGTSATQIVDEDGTGIVNTAIFASPRLMQQTDLVTVVLDHSEAVTSATVCVWVFRGVTSVTPTSSATDDDTNGTAIVLTTGTTTTGGFVVCVSGDSTTTETVTWAVVSEVQDAETGEHSYSNAEVATTGASMANTATWSSTSDASGSCAAVR